MKRQAKKAVSYGSWFQSNVVYAVVRDGFSIASVCTQYGIDEMYKVREWVRDYMKKHGMVRIPRTLTRRGNAPKTLFSEPVNRQFKRYEEIILYQECLIEAFYENADEKIKKKLLDQLSPKQRKSLKRKGKLST